MMTPKFYLKLYGIALAAFLVIDLVWIGFFAIVPGLKKNNALPGLFNAAVFGIVTYGTYDLTNLALIQDWPVSVTIVDMVWGMSVSVMVTGITMTAGRSIPRQDD